MAYRLTETRHGKLLVNPKDTLGTMVIKHGEYSEGEVDLFSRLIDENTVVLEVGANIGALTVPLSRIAKAVFAFEPQRLVFQMLCANLALNDVINVVAINGAVGATPGVVAIPVLHPDYENSFGSLGVDQWGEGESVRRHTIDGMNLVSVGFMKVDVEGMEEEVLIGARKTIMEHRPIIYFEADRLERRESLFRYVQNVLNYDMWWHTPPVYNEDNFYKNTVNDYVGYASFNVLSFPKEFAFKCDLTRIEV